MTRAGVFLITLSGLIFEIGLTRIYSATIWYHFTFVAVSVALLGWGLGGLLIYLLRGRLRSSPGTAAGLALAYGLAIPACLWVLARFPFRPALLALYFAAPLVPFLLAGMALAMIFDLGRERAGAIYFADLVGASAGAVAVTFLLQALGGEGTLLVAGALPCLAAALLSRGLRIAGLLVAAGVLASTTVTGVFHIVPGTTKAMRRQMDEHPGSRVTQSGWNAYSRIDGVEGLDPSFLARLYIDSDAWTSVSRWDGRPESAGSLAGSFRALPFRLEPGAETLVIGPGGGSDVVAALASGSRHVTAVELNPLMIQFVRHYGAAAGNLYDRPDVEVIQSEGRNFISRTPRRFDVIFLGFVDSWASVASGGLSLSENYLYTTEAFRAYYDHLTPDGMLVILRWDLDVPRLVSNAVALLGARAASSQVAVLMERREAAPDNPPQMLFMLRKRPFTPAETGEIASWTSAAPLILAGHHVAAPYDGLLSGRVAPAAYAAAATNLVGPVFDDSPFYFATERPFGMSTGIAKRLIGWLVLPSLGLLALFAAFGRPRGYRAAPYLASLVYFACLGFGFIVIELALLQQLTLLVGHPIFTLSVLLFTLLAAGGIGSAVSRFVRARVACLAVVVLGGLEAWLLPTLVPALLPWSLSARIAAAAVAIAPLGLMMGMPFPIGLRRTGQGPRPAPPFYWGLNGVMSVIGSVTTVFVAMAAGFQVAMLVGCGAYLLAAVVAETGLAKD